MAVGVQFPASASSSSSPPSSSSPAPTSALASSSASPRSHLLCHFWDGLGHGCNPSRIKYLRRNNGLGLRTLIVLFLFYSDSSEPAGVAGPVIWFVSMHCAPDPSLRSHQLAEVHVAHLYRTGCRQLTLVLFRAVCSATQGVSAFAGQLTGPLVFVERSTLVRIVADSLAYVSRLSKGVAGVGSRRRL